MDYLLHSIGMLLQCIGAAIVTLALWSPVLYAMYIDHKEHEGRQ